MDDSDRLSHYDGTMRAPNRRPNLRRIRAEMDATSVRTWDNALFAGGPGGIVFASSPGAWPAGRRVYAVGDVHGQLDKLRAMHAAIEADIASRPIAAVTLVHLGDFIDWGLDSAGVVALLARPAFVTTVNLA